MRTYNELMCIENFNERIKYLQTFNGVGSITAGSLRYINQRFYSSSRWKQIRRNVIIRDNGFDLGFENLIIKGRIIVHHIEPINVQDIIDYNPKVYSLSNLISCSHATHQDIHYNKKEVELKKRSKDDTKLW